MMKDFSDKLQTFTIIREKLDEVQENITIALNMGFVDIPDSKNRSYWERSDIMTLSALDKRIQDAKLLVLRFIHELKKGHTMYEIS